MGPAVSIDKGNMAKGAMNTFNFMEQTLVALVLLEKGTDTFSELLELFWREGDGAIWKVPEESNIDLDKEKMWVTLRGMPRDL